MRLRWVQPSLFRKPTRTLVWLFPTKSSSVRALKVHGGGTRQATRRYTVTGDLWQRKSRGRLL